MEYQRGDAVQPPKHVVPKQMTPEDDGLQRAMDELGQQRRNWMRLKSL